MQIYIKPRHEPQKEISLVKANRLLKSGVLDGEELAWTAGLTDWIVLKMIKGIEKPTPPPLPVSLARKPIDMPNNRSSIDKNELHTIKPEVPKSNLKTVEKQVVMQSSDCPKCGLLNPPNALICDCGYSL